MRKPSRDTVLQEIKVTDPSELLQFLIAKNVRKSRNAIKSLLAHKQIKVNSKLVTQFDHQLGKGDIVSVMKFNQARKSKRLKGLTIVFEDEYLIVIEKEAGVLSVATDRAGAKTVYNTLSEYIRQSDRNARPLVVHRLDREVSGLMAFAKDSDVQKFFQTSWDKIVPVYTYVAVVNGVPNPPNGTITSWLTENKNFVVFSSEKDNGGLKAVTHYNTIKSSSRYALLSYNMETRRKNQIRVHMQSLGHPIVGDRKYGALSSPIKRIALHAQDMEIIHPITKERLSFKSPLPKRMADMLTTKPMPNGTEHHE